MAHREDVTNYRRALRRTIRDFAALRRRVKRRLGCLAPLRITLYGGYGTCSAIRVLGRVLEETPAADPTASDRGLSNFKRAFAQLESDEVPGVEIELTAGGTRAHAITDEDGYIDVRVPLAIPAATPWLPVHARVVRAPYPLRAAATATTSVLIPGRDARFGVISDIDDTLLRTHVQNKLKMLYVTLLGNALTRLSFEGTRDLYRGLARAGQDAPFFYVSHSMWNIFPLLDRFIAHQGLPRGPLLLRDVSLFRERGAHPDKARAIEDVFATYPDLRFVLLGDSGERDLEIYLDAARAHPGRILTILIRNVSDIASAVQLRELAKGAVHTVFPALVFDDSHQAIAHCRELGLWVPPYSAAPAPRGASAR